MLQRTQFASQSIRFAPYLAPCRLLGKLVLRPISSLLAAEIVTGADRRQIRPCQPCSLTGPSRSSGAIPCDSGQHHVMRQLQPKIRSSGIRNRCPATITSRSSKKKPLTSTVLIFGSGFAPFFFSLLFFLSLSSLALWPSAIYTSAAVGGFRDLNLKGAGG